MKEGSESILSKKDYYQLMCDLVSRDFNFNDYVIVCVGSAKVLLDSLGPVIGDMLSKECKDARVIGTTKEPCNALTLKYMESKIEELNKYYKILAIDAAIGSDKSRIGKITFKTGSVMPRAGYEVNTLPHIGDYAITGTTLDASNKKLLYNSKLMEHEDREFYLSNLYNLARLIVDALKEADQLYREW